MARKLTLPLTDSARKPTVEAMRKKLGGRASTEAGAGEYVALRGETQAGKAGVILFVRGEERCVWTAHGVVRRVRSGELASLRDAVPRALEAIARDARVFAAILEGERVHYQEHDGRGEGTLVEKCRFGGLVERADGTILGVGFRRLWPAGNVIGRAN